MPTIEIRDTVDGKVTTDATGFGYLTRRINLPPGLRSELLNLDVYNDNVEMLSYRAAPESAPSGYQLYLSPYPVQITNGFLQMNPSTVLPNVGPLAGTKRSSTKNLVLQCKRLLILRPLHLHCTKTNTLLRKVLLYQLTSFTRHICM